MQDKKEFKQFIEENKEIIKRVAIVNPSLSIDDEWRGEKFWDTWDNQNEKTVQE